MGILASEPVSIAKILDTSIKLYAASFSRLLGIISILAVFYIIMGLITAQFQPNTAAPPTAESMALLTDNLPLLFGFGLVFLIISFVLYAALIYRLDNVANEREDSLSEAATFGLKQFPAMFIAMLLYIVAIILGYILLLIPGIILTLSLSFYLYFIVIDSYGGYSALKASHSLIWGHWWRTMAVFTVPMIVWIALMFTLGFVSALLAAGNQVVLQILMNLLSVIFTPYFFALGYVQFNDLKLRKSGSDLAFRLAR